MGGPSKDGSGGSPSGELDAREAPRPAARDPAAACGRGSAERQTSPDELVQDGAHELLLALRGERDLQQHRTGAAETAAAGRGGQPERRCVCAWPHSASASSSSCGVPCPEPHMGVGGAVQGGRRPDARSGRHGSVWQRGARARLRGTPPPARTRARGRTSAHSMVRLQAAAASGPVAEQPAGQKAPGGVYDAFDCEESLMAAQTLSGLAQLEARKVAAEKKERKNFAKDTVEELKKWFASHLDHPYPDEEDKEELARKTNLNVAQVSAALSRFLCDRPHPHARCGTDEACEGFTLSAWVAGELLVCERPKANLAAAAA